MQVTQALELSLDAHAKDRLTGQGTENLQAYLAFLQGRSLLANHRVVDTKEAIGHFERAIKLDPKFAAAYVSLAEAELFVAEYDVTDDRQARFERALLRGRELVEQALALDPDNGDAYLERAHLASFDDLAAAEADYRRGLELSPNAANGYAGLATVLYATASRRDEALEMLDRARKLDPLEPDYDVFKAVFLFYERADLKGANDLLVEVLREHPQDVPALIRLCELRSFAMGRLADGVLYCEQALAIDPLAAEARLHLIKDYHELGESAAAEQVAGEAGRDSVVPQVLAPDVRTRLGPCRGGRIRRHCPTDGFTHRHGRDDRSDPDACPGHGRHASGEDRNRGPGRRDVGCSRAACVAGRLDGHVFLNSAGGRDVARRGAGTRAKTARRNHRQD